jgi:hypothetical protein
MSKQKFEEVSQADLGAKAREEAAETIELRAQMDQVIRLTATALHRYHTHLNKKAPAPKPDQDETATLKREKSREDFINRQRPECWDMQSLVHWAVYGRPLAFYKDKTKRIGKDLDPEGPGLLLYRYARKHALALHAIRGPRLNFNNERAMKAYRLWGIGIYGYQLRRGEDVVGTVILDYNGDVAYREGTGIPAWQRFKAAPDLERVLRCRTLSSWDLRSLGNCNPNLPDRKKAELAADGWVWNDMDLLTTLEVARIHSGWSNFDERLEEILLRDI